MMTNTERTKKKLLQKALVEFFGYASFTPLMSKNISPAISGVFKFYKKTYAVIATKSEILAVYRYKAVKDELTMIKNYPAALIEHFRNTYNFNFPEQRELQF